MKKTITFLIALLPLFSTAQGIKFEEGLSWEQVKQKAKQENKYIFVDAYATWCVPCKQMDKEVYVLEKVGDCFNKNFISVRVQMDKTTKDNEIVKQWYKDAEQISKQFDVNALPAYLFFYSNGEIVHRAVGYKSADEFLELGKDAATSSKQYYTLLKDFKEGKNSGDMLKYLAIATKEKGDDKLATEIADQYLNNLDSTFFYTLDIIEFISKFNKTKKGQAIAAKYKIDQLDKLADSEILKKANFSFIISFPSVVHSKDRFFYSFFNLGNVVDSLVQRPGLSNAFVNYVITREEITSKLYVDGKPIATKPNWTKIENQIRKKYGHIYAETIITDQKSNFYFQSKDWEKWASIFEAKLKKNPPTQTSKYLHSWGDVFVLNDMSWNAFLNCDNKKVLKKALKWSELSIKLNNVENDPQGSGLVQYLDTRANLLYKLGRVNEAIEQEQKAIDLDNANAKRDGKKKGSEVDEYTANIEKMKIGAPTWPEVLK